MQANARGALLHAEQQRERISPDIEDAQLWPVALNQLSGTRSTQMAVPKPRSRRNGSLHALRPCMLDRPLNKAGTHSISSSCSLGQ
jgi:hypothetical protein